MINNSNMTLKSYFFALLLGNLIFFSLGAFGKTSVLLQQGQDFYQQGNFTQALENWQTALQKIDPKRNLYFDTLIHLAATYQALGNYSDAISTLQQALAFAQHSNIPAQLVLVHSYLGDILLATQNLEEAQNHLESQLELAYTLDDKFVLANLLNNLGNVFSVQQKYPQALANYQQATNIAKQLGNVLLQVQTLSNQAQVYHKQNQNGIKPLRTALALAYKLPNSYAKAFHLLALGQLALHFQNQQSSLNIFQIFTTVLQLAEQYQDKRLMSYAKGFLGQLYENEQRYPEAQQLTRQAIFLAQAEPDVLYLWKWQQARLMQAQNNLAEASLFYQQALSYLQPIRMGLIIGQRNASEAFYERVRPVYYGLADVLLQQASNADSTLQKHKFLLQAREAVEQIKVAELKDYFQDDCVSANQIPLAKLEQLTQHQNTAIVYPVQLPQRTELLLSLPDGNIRQIVVPVSYNTLKQTALTFRKNLQRATAGSFIKQAKQLYQWLITPLLDELTTNKINTLVIVPDGFLRTIPFAALYDANAKQFLFHYFALAVTPGLTLTDPHHLSRDKVGILLNGLSEGVQGFSPLPNVSDEISNISKLFSNNAVLLNQAFSLQGIDKALQSVPYEIVHISSHGQFDRNPKKSFLLTYDDKLTIDRLESLFKLSELRKDKVELLTLSACQTAVGDERAALGLAGIAIKAGARSALASLWFVDDEATSELVTEFYQQLQNPTLSKAQALQNAQKKLAKQAKFRHPAFWAPFLLIGNWL